MRVSAHGICKRFGSVTALDRVDFELQDGEVHALVGENGAGKTTLMRILYGMERADAGTIEVNGRVVRISDPQTASRLGIGMVHQRFRLIPSLPVVENVVLGAEPNHLGWLDRGRARSEVETLSHQYGLELDPDEVVGKLPVGLQQRVEILRLLYRRSEVLIFDEPTAVLTPSESETLFHVIRNLKAQGKSIIYISHKLWEIMAIADRVTVLRLGRVQRSLARADATPELLTRLMVGEELAPLRRQINSAPGETLLELKDVSAMSDMGVPALRSVSLQLRAGEILGVAGVEGNGQRELAEVIVGVRPVEAGTISIRGSDVTLASTQERRKRGLAYIPEDRDKEGVSLDLPIADNMIALRFDERPLSAGGILFSSAIAAWCERLIREYSVRAASVKMPARGLSGGNLQKVIVARELAGDPYVVVAFHPFRGLDVGSTRFVHEKLLELSAAGRGVLLISGDLDEILGLSDRVAVLYRGQVAGVVSSSQASRERIGALMLGQRVG